VESQAEYEQFFRHLGARLKVLRNKSGYSQEDMLSFGFSTRHWQQIEAGRPITLTTLLRVCDVFKATPDKLLKGLYEPTAAQETK
jgi:transcriptional regulator with XRE-family HTH domain